MKPTRLGVMAMTVLSATAGSALAQDLTLDFGPEVGSQIIFNGGPNPSFNFTPGSVSLANPLGNQWNVTGETGSANLGTAYGDQGSIGNGPFYIGPVMSSGSYQTASVLGPIGALSIHDKSGGVLTGMVNFIDISTYGPAFGAINDLLDINLTGVTYNGMESDLTFLTQHQPGVIDLSFQFAFVGGGKTLSQLATPGSVASTSYSGSIYVTAVPEPTTLAMSSLGAIGALGLAFRNRKKS